MHLNTCVICTTLICTIKLIYNIMKGVCVVIKSVIISKVYKVTVNSEELIGSTTYLKLQMSCPIN